MKKKNKNIIIVAIILFNILIIVYSIGLNIAEKKAAEQLEAEKKAINTVQINNDKFKKSKYGFDDADVIGQISSKGIYKLNKDYYFNEYRTSKYFEIYFNNIYSNNEYIAEASLERLEILRQKLVDFFKVSNESVPVAKLYMFKNTTELQENLENMHGILDYNYTGLVNVNSLYIPNDGRAVNYFVEYFLRVLYGEKTEIPKWILLGAASYFNNSVDSNSYFYTTYSKYELDNLDFDKLASDYFYAGKYANSLIYAIVEKYGEDGLRKLITTGGDLKEALNTDENNLFSVWEAYVANNIPEKLYAVDTTNYVELLDKSSEYKDENGFIYNKYYKTEHIEIYYFEEFNYDKIAKEAGDLLEEKYAKIISSFGLEESDLPVIKVKMCTSSYELYSDSHKALFPVDYNIGYITAANRINYIHSDYTKYGKWEYVLPQLLAHCAYATKMNKLYPEYYSNESWLIEGLSLYYSFDSDLYTDYYPEIFENGIEFDNEYKIIKFKNYENNYAYGYTLIDTIIRDYGKDKLEEIIREPNKIEEILGCTLEEFNEKYKNYYKEQYLYNLLSSL